MPTLTIHTVDNLIAFMEKVTDSLTGSSNLSWFRGVGNADEHKLHPKLYRHPAKTGIDEYLKLEREMLDRFRERSIMFRHKNMEFRDDRELDTLVVMQHFGAPTRLLDWSESPFVALYFALTSERKNFRLNPPTYDHDAAVWILQPEVWNFKARGERIQDKIIFSLHHNALDGYRPQQRVMINGANLGITALAVYGPHNNERVVAQRGAFTLFGSNVTAMEDQYIAGNHEQDSLVKILIPKDKIDILLSQLVAMGTSDSTVFPDLGGVAKEIARQQGYQI